MRLLSMVCNIDNTYGLLNIILGGYHSVSLTTDSYVSFALNNSLSNSGQRNNCCWTIRNVTVKFKRKEIQSNIRCPKHDVYTNCNGDYQLCSGSNNTCMPTSLKYTVNNSHGNHYSCTSVSATANTNSINVPVVTTCTSLESSEIGLTRLTSIETSTTSLTNSEFIETSTKVISDKTSSLWMNFQTSVTFVEESMTSLTVVESAETSMTVLIRTLVTSNSPSMNVVTSSIIPTTSTITSLTGVQSMTSPTSMTLITNTPVTFSTNILTRITPTETVVTGLTSIESITSLTNTVISSPKTSSLSINVPINVTPTKPSLTSQPSTDVSYSKSNGPSMSSLFGVTLPESSITSLTNSDAIFTGSPKPSNCPADSIWPETLSGHNLTGFYCYKGTVNGKY